MDPVLHLEPARLSVEPGSEAVATVTVRNVAQIVDHYHIDVVGPLAAFAEVSPADIAVMPGRDAQVRVVLRPPRGPETPAGAVAFGVRCVSRDQADASAVVEGDVEIAPAVELQAQLYPSISGGSFRSRRTTLSLVNRGSVPLQVFLQGADAAGALRYEMPPSVAIAPGAVSDVPLRIVPLRRFVFGQSVHHNFKVRLTDTQAAAGAPATRTREFGVADGTFVQRPVISRRVVAVAIGVVTLLIALAALAPAYRSSPKPEAASDLKITEAQLDGVDLEWTAGKHADTYIVTLFLNDREIAHVEDVQSTSYKWKEGLSLGQRPCFSVISVNGEGRSKPTRSVCTPEPLSALIDGDPAAPKELNYIPRPTDKVIVSFADTLPSGHSRELSIRFCGEPCQKWTDVAAPPASPAPTQEFTPIGDGTYEVGVRWINDKGKTKLGPTKKISVKGSGQTDANTTTSTTTSSTTTSSTTTISTTTTTLPGGTTDATMVIANIRWFGLDGVAVASSTPCPAPTGAGDWIAEVSLTWTGAAEIARPSVGADGTWAINDPPFQPPSGISVWVQARCYDRAGLVPASVTYHSVAWVTP
jgi:hypothetical protein